jgi:exodeoxyribonuclease VII large subunit
MAFTLTPSAGTTRDVYTVSRLNREARLLLEGGLPLLWIEGEISNLARPASGHVYFSLKDTQCQVRCAFFRQHQRAAGAVLRDGLQVMMRARVSLYEGRGEFQLIVEHIEEAGEGALRRAFEILKARLAAEGLFGSERKQPLPRLPRRIALVTSPTGAVVHDILTTLKRRFPAIGIVLYPVPVQGEGAAEKIAQAIRFAGRQRGCDALIVARGGGSLEDLQAFNEEIVARAIDQCPIPVVTGVGHETDITIADFVADARAPTPTAAAEMLSPHWEDWLAQYQALEARLSRALRGRLLHLGQRLDGLSVRLVHPRQRLALLHHRLQTLNHRLAHAQRERLHAVRLRLMDMAARMRASSPAARLEAVRLRVDYLQRRIHHAAQHHLAGAGDRLQHLAATLQALSPLATLARGYAIVLGPDGAVLRNADRVAVGERVRVRMARGELGCRVEDKRDA